MLFRKRRSIVYFEGIATIFTSLEGLNKRSDNRKWSSSPSDVPRCTSLLNGRHVSGAGPKSTRRSFLVISRVAVSPIANHVLLSLNYRPALLVFGTSRADPALGRPFAHVTKQPPVNRWPYRLPDTGNRFARKYRIRASLLDSRRVNLKPIVSNWRVNLPLRSVKSWFTSLHARLQSVSYLSILACSGGVSRLS